MAKKQSTPKHSNLKHAAAYATAAGAAMAVAAPAQAAIHWSGPKDLVLNRDHTPVAVDLNGDGIADFSFSHYGLFSSKYYGTNTTLFLSSQVMGLIGNTGNSAVGSTHYAFPYRLQQGDMVSEGMAGAWTYYGYLAAGAFAGIHTSGTNTYPYGSVRFGNFIDQEGFVGVRFQIDGNTHYGWIAFEGTWDPPGWSEGRITGWAYEDVPDTAIAAGDQGPQPPIPTLNEWGMIFLAALILASGAYLMKTRREEI